MGGNLFPGTQSINKRYIKSTTESLFNEHLIICGVPKYKFIGSTGKANVSGDIDLCIACSPSNKKMLTEKLENRLGKSNVKISGQNIAVKYHIVGFEQAYVQIDLMLAEKHKLDDTAWLMSGDSQQGVKGVYRNLMISMLAKKKSETMSPDKKITVSFPGGLAYKTQNGKNWKDDGPRETSPTNILKAVGINENPDNIITFSQLVDFMIKDNVLCKYLSDFPDYINSYILKSPESANRALWYIRTKMRLMNEQGTN
jgi:hypothetical protein